MIVSHILDSKGHEVVTARQSLTVAEVAVLISERRIGAVVISDDGKVVQGIISERDIVRAVATAGAEALTMEVAQFMTRSVVTSTGDETINQVMERMTNGRFRHLPVLKDGQLHGIVSIGDVVKQHVAEIENEASAMRAYIASA